MELFFIVIEKRACWGMSDLNAMFRHKDVIKPTISRFYEVNKILISWSSKFKAFLLTCINNYPT